MSVEEDCPQLEKPPPAAAEGLCAYVLKNGFETKQGKLMRMILFSSDRVTVESAEVYYYLLILLGFALVASYLVMSEGLKDPDRSRYKIMLRCVLIITNVVPPELPMQLSLAVNYSILTLIKKVIFCTEPFRIPNAGKINICCFDKTGTLTQNDLIIKGLTAMNLAKVHNWNPKKSVVDINVVPLADVKQHSRDSLLVLGGCHTLAMAEDQLVGDPIEKQAFEGIGFKHDGRLTSTSKDGSIKIRKLKGFLFESALKRQSSIVQIQQSGSRGGGVRVLCKGAPEVVEQFLAKVPDGYKEHYIGFVKDGARVLTLAYKDISTGADQAKEITRADAESNLQFAGFIVSECPLKPDTKGVIEELTSSGHECKMITGDNQLTAAYVAQDCRFAPKLRPDSSGKLKSLFVADVVPAQGLIRWNDIDENHAAQTKSIAEVAALAKTAMLCVTGSLLDKVFEMTSAGAVIRHFHVFSRTSPNQKTAIVAKLNNEGNTTMMTGDGTNDVGSLKRADVGLAIVNNTAPSKEDKAKKKTMSMWPPMAELSGLPPEELKKKIAEHQEEYKRVSMAQMGDPTMELGDACIAAPFTYKFTSLKSVKRTIREGRKTLTTTFQMYKILSLNSLISAYTMSALYLDGVKMGDY
jgi:cation-transporting ATPase 13A1